jgi:hypothetical protein
MSSYRKKGGHGGKRPGAGRPPGAPNKIKRKSEILQRLKAKGRELPLDRLLRRMADKTETERYRDSLALAAAPFVHPRLNSLPTPMATFEMTDHQLEDVLRREAEQARRQGDLKAARQIEERLRDDGWALGGRKPNGRASKPNGRA